MNKNDGNAFVPEPKTEDTEELKKVATEESVPADEKPTVAQKPTLDPDAFLAKASSGTLQLTKPIRAGGQDVNELQYDFQKLTGWEYAEAVDSDKNAQTIFRLTAKQALNLFAMAAGKATARIDANDIKERIGVEDSMAAVQLAIVFFNACALKRNKRTTKE